MSVRNVIAAAARLLASVKVAFGPHMLCRAEGGEINAEPHPGCPDFFFGDLDVYGDLPVHDPTLILCLEGEPDA